MEHRSPPASPAASDVREPYEEVTYEKLRAEVSRRGLRIIRSGPSKNYTKPGFMALLREHDQGDQASSAPSGTAVAARPASPSTHCHFRLLNVLFSDAFASRRAALHAAGATARAAFWAEVREAFASDDAAFARRIADHACLARVQPGVVLPRSAQKLHAMWDKLSSAHRRARAAADSAGATADFFDFCQGDAGVYYLDCWLRLRPEARASAQPKAKAVSAGRPVHQEAAREASVVPPRVVQLVTDESVLDVLRALLETTSERAFADKRQQTQRQWLELAASVEQMRERAKRCRADSEELADVEEDLRVALQRKRQLREEISRE